jgi:hypothetical protein
MEAPGREGVRFTLQYDGPLPGNGSAAAKQAIRRRLHEQFDVLWGLEHELSCSGEMWMPEATLKGNAMVVNPSDTDQRFAFVRLGGFRWVPLVQRRNHTRCSLRIRFLRHGHPGDLIKSGGDLDGRLKTFFDALRMPHTEAELGGATPTSPDQRFYCLLEDDSLITDFSIEADRLLRRQTGPHDELDAVVYTDVRLTEELF